MKATKAQLARKPKLIDRIMRPQATPAPSTDDAQEKHPRSSSTTCGATRNIAGTVHTCTLKPLHGGVRHNDGQRTWRVSSGDSE